jgi:outer membrane protein insertion porin family
MDGRETIQLRGYPNNSLTPINSRGEQLELPFIINSHGVTLSYNLKIICIDICFRILKQVRLIQISKPTTHLSRSAGVGLRVFMPAFGLLGIDFGHGFDALPGQIKPNGWETHFIIGQQF